MDVHKFKRTDNIVKSVIAPRRDICPYCKIEQTTVHRHMQRKHPREWQRRQEILSHFKGTGTKEFSAVQDAALRTGPDVEPQLNLFLVRIHLSFVTLTC